MSQADIDRLPAAVRNFRPRCPGCHPEMVILAGARPCSYYDCPGLPEQLHVTCDLCLYDFAADEGQVKCDHTTCPTAARLRANLPVYRTWVEMILAESVESSESSS